MAALAAPAAPAAARGWPARASLRRQCLVAASQEPLMHLSSAQGVQVKHCVKLRESAKYREESLTGLVCGRDLVEELAPVVSSIRAIIALDAEQLPWDIPAVRYVTATPAVLKKITGLGTCAPDTLAAEVALPPPADLLGMPAGQLRRVLVLDGIQDPGNLGTLCRTALALGWQAAVLLPGCCDPFNDKAIRASRGAVFKLPVAHMSLEQWQQLVQAHGLVALAAEPDRSGSTSSSSGRGKASQQQQGAAGQQGGDLAELPVALCLGAEGQGVSAQLWAQCRAVTIPQAGGGALMESLNVAAAGSILMFALSRGAGPLLAELGAL